MAAFSPDNKQLLTGYYLEDWGDRQAFPKTASLWEVDTGKELWSLQAADFEVNAFAFMPDGKQILIGTHDGLKLLNAANGKVVRSFGKKPGLVHCLAVSPDGKLALSHAGGENTDWGDLTLWDLASGKPIQILHTGSFGPVTFSANGKLMMAVGGGSPPPLRVGASSDPVIWVWDVPKRDLLVALQKSEGWFEPVALSPDGKLGVARKQLQPTTQTALVLWEATTGKPVGSLPEDGATSVAFTADGKGLLAGNPHKDRLVLWDVATGKEVWTVDGVRTSCYAFSPDGKLAVTAVGNLVEEPDVQKCLTIWDAVHGKRLGTLGNTGT
jgi:WD40 repeat protein